MPAPWSVAPSGEYKCPKWWHIFSIQTWVYSHCITTWKFCISVTICTTVKLIWNEGPLERLPVRKELWKFLPTMGIHAKWTSLERQDFLNIKNGHYRQVPRYISTVVWIVAKTWKLMICTAVKLQTIHSLNQTWQVPVGTFVLQLFGFHVFAISSTTLIHRFEWYATLCFVQSRYTCNLTKFMWWEWPFLRDWSEWPFCKLMFNIRPVGDYLFERPLFVAFEV